MITHINDKEVKKFIRQGCEFKRTDSIYRFLLNTYNVKTYVSETPNYAGEYKRR